MSTALPRIHIQVNGAHRGEFFWDSRLQQLRKVDNPHVFQDVDSTHAIDLDLLCPKEAISYVNPGPPRVVTAYRRIS